MTAPRLDDTLFDDPSIPASFDTFRVEGLLRHLWRYSSQLSSGHAIARLEDLVWRDAIARALAEQPAAQVLDIGAGYGLLSMMAARAAIAQRFANLLLRQQAAARGVK